MKVLILAYDFPPLISIGAQRPYSWYKYLPAAQRLPAGQAGLPDTGISVTVITRQWTDKISSPTDYVMPMTQKAYEETDKKGNHIIRAPFFPNLRDKLLINFGLNKLVFVRKVLTYFYSFLEHLFFIFDSKAHIYREAKRAIEQNKPDFIIATAEPFILFKYAHLLSAQYNIPWIADYRDGWNTNQGEYKRGMLERILSSFYKKRERQYISNALLITTAAPSYAEALQKLHPDKEIKVIYNGYDEEYLDGIDKISPPQGKFTIAYTGTIYPHQNLEMFLDGFSLFISKEKIAPGQVQVCFYGSGPQPQVLDRLFNYRKELKDYIITKPRIPYGELIKKLRASHLLLLLSKNGAQWLNAKIFDYIAVKRKIFLVENDSSILEQLINETGSGVSLNNAEQVSEFLKQEYSSFKKGLTTEPPFNAADAKYSRKNQANILASILKDKYTGLSNK